MTEEKTAAEEEKKRKEFIEQEITAEDLAAGTVFYLHAVFRKGRYNITSCARGDTTCPRPTPPPCAPQRLAPRRADAT